MQPQATLDEPLAAAGMARAETLDTSEFVLTTLRSIHQGSIPLGSPYPDPAMFPWARLNQYANSISRRSGEITISTDLPPGNPELIRQIARRHLENGLAVDSAEIIVTTGATEALSPAYRIGSTLPGRYRAQVEKLKFLNAINTAALPQLAIAEYLRNDGYDYHLRKVRKTYAQQASIMAAAVRRFFPAGTITSQPAGGYLLWVTLPDGVPALELYARAQERGITVGLLAGELHAKTPI